MPDTLVSARNVNRFRPGQINAQAVLVLATTKARLLVIRKILLFSTR